MAKCKDCGYLAVRDEYNDTVCEATEFTRERGLHKSSEGMSTPARLLCFKNSTSFHTGRACTVETRDAKLSQMKLANEQLASEVECKHFRKWMPGRSPKEHEEMSFLEMIDNRTRQWREEDIKRTQAFEALYETRHQELRNDAENRDRRSTKITILGIAVAILAAIVSGTLSGWLSK